MPKPTDSVPDWASTANFPASVYPATYPWGDAHPNAGDPTPWSGQPTRDSAGLAALAAQGTVPAEPNYSPSFNEFLARVADWAQWVEDGDDSGAANAHIVETDADGTISQLAAALGNSATATATLILDETAGGDRALQVTEVSGSDVAANFQGTGTFETVSIGTSGAAAGLIVTSTYAGSALSSGRAIVGNAGGDGNAIEGYADAEGYGLAGYGGTSTGAGVYGEGAASSSPGGLFEGASGFANSYGVEGRANHPDAWGVWGLADNLGSASGAGVVGQGQDDATGVRGLGDDGYGVVAESDTTSPVRSSFRMVPQDAEPSSGAEGDMYTHNLQSPGIFAVGAWRRMWMSTGGLAHGYGNDGATPGSPGNAGGTFTNVASCSLSEPQAPRKTGAVLIEVTGNFGFNSSPGGVPSKIGELKVVDTTAAVDAVPAWSLYGLADDSSLAEPGHSFSRVFVYTLPAAGGRAFTLQMRSTYGGNIEHSGMSLRVIGVF